MAKDKKVIDQDPQGGGSYIRQPDGSLTKNESDPQTTPASEMAEHKTEE